LFFLISFVPTTKDYKEIMTNITSSLF